MNEGLYMFLLYNTVREKEMGLFVAGLDDIGEFAYYRG